jgi:hypothetical protein
LVLAVGCAAQQPDPSAHSAADVIAPSTASSNHQVGAADSSEPSSPDDPGAESRATTAGSDAGTADRHPTDVDSKGRASEPAGLRGDSPYVWQLKASVSPRCVRAGEVVTVTVLTAPTAAIGYVAVYAGEKSGAAPPFGYGYGGNAAGYSDQSGTWTQTWTVRADAPVGPARTTVVAASHQTNKQVDVPFTVVDPVTGSC